MAWIAILIGAILAFSYTFQVWQYSKYGRASNGQSANSNGIPDFTILVPFRNESKHLPALVESLQQLAIPHSNWSVSLINDHSTDESLAILESLSLPSHFNILQAPANHTGKKKALTWGMEQADTDWVICTDADCTMQPDWIAALFSGIDYNGVWAICGPVHVMSQNSVLTEVQMLDMLGVMGMTAAGHRHLGFQLANGANLAFRQSVFMACGGFTGSEQHASGDDIWIVQQLAAKDPRQIAFQSNPAAQVSTMATTPWAAFWMQRLRWAGKTTAYKSNILKRHIGIAFAFSVWLIFGWLGVLVWSNWVWIMLMFWGLRILVDYWYLNQLAKHYRLRMNKILYCLVQVAHVFYLVGIGGLSLFKKSYSWKGRTLR